MHRFRRVFAAALLLCTGCLFSSTRVFEFDVIGNANLASPLRVTGAQTGEAYVELVRNRVYEESRSDIQVVDRAGFAGNIVNRGGAPATLEIYFSHDPGLTDPGTEAVHLLSIAVPSAGRELSFEDSEESIENLLLLREAIRSGAFHLYLAAGGGGDLDVASLLLIVSLTVEP